MPEGIELNSTTAIMVLVNSAPESAILPVIAGVGGAGLLALVFLLLRRFRRQPVSHVEDKPNP